ncbi:hypothetical protein IWQ60_012191, partial [Tieghemiomyces parasiticus]
FTEGKAALVGIHGCTLHALQQSQPQPQQSQPQPQSQSQPQDLQPQPQLQQTLVQSTLQPLSKRFTLKEPSRKRTRNNQGQSYTPGLQAQVQAQAKVIEGLTKQIATLTTLVKALQSPQEPSTTTQQPYSLQLQPSASLQPSPSLQLSPSPSPQPQPSPSPSPQQSSPHPSYADIISKRGIKDKVKALEALCSLRPTYKGKVTTKPEFAYVQGIGCQPVGKLCEALKVLRFNTSKILNVAFIGNATAEFLLSPDYVRGFKKAISEVDRRDGWKVLPAFDALKAADPKAPADLKKRVQEAAINRVYQTIKSTTYPEVAQAFKDKLVHAGIPLPETLVEKAAVPIPQALASSGAGAMDEDNTSNTTTTVSPFSASPFSTSPFSNSSILKQIYTPAFLTSPSELQVHPSLQSSLSFSNSAPAPGSPSPVQ